MVIDLISKKYYILNQNISSDKITKSLSQINGVLAVQVVKKDKYVKVDYCGQIEDKLIEAFENNFYLVEKIENAEK